MSHSSEPPSAASELDDAIEACHQLAGTPASDGSEERASLSAVQLDAMRTELSATLEREPRWRSRLWQLSRGRRVALLTAIAVLATAAAAAFVPRADLAAYPFGRMAISLVLLLALFALAGFASFRPLHLPAAPAARAGAILLATALLPLVWLAVPLEHVGHPPGEGVGFLVASLRCLLFGSVFGAPVMILAWAASRADVGGMLVAALAGVAGGLTGNLVLQVHCPITDVGHLLAGHGALIPLLLLLSASPVRRILRRRRSR